MSSSLQNPSNNNNNNNVIDYRYQKALKQISKLININRDIKL